MLIETPLYEGHPDWKTALDSAQSFLKREIEGVGMG